MNTSKKSRRLKAKTSPRKIRIEFHVEGAEQVSVAGTFNNWRPDTTPMAAAGKGLWVKDLVLAPGRYEYRLVVDGQWRCDPAASQQVPNPYGTNNSVLEVPAVNGQKKP